MSGPETGNTATAPAKNVAGTITPDELLALVRFSLTEDKAEDVVTIDLAGKSSMADYMVVASGRSARQVSSMAEKLLDRLKEAGMGRRPNEGKTQGDWALIDAGDVIVHIFRPEVRDFYDLEKMWSAAAPTAPTSVS